VFLEEHWTAVCSKTPLTLGLQGALGGLLALLSTDCPSSHRPLAFGPGPLLSFFFYGIIGKE
jgi:hypothetical protein